jgi:hypothetical protein
MTIRATASGQPRSEPTIRWRRVCAASLCGRCSHHSASRLARWHAAKSSPSGHRPPPGALSYLGPLWMVALPRPASLVSRGLRRCCAAAASPATSGRRLRLILPPFMATSSRSFFGSTAGCSGRDVRSRGGISGRGRHPPEHRMGGCPRGSERVRQPQNDKACLPRDAWPAVLAWHPSETTSLSARWNFPG